MKKTALLLLIAMLITAIASCSGGTAESSASQTENKNQNETVADETVTEPEIKPDMPDLDYDGLEINMWYFTKNSDVSEKFIDIAGELNGDVVDEALYYRNIAVEERLGVDIVFTDTGVASSDVGASIRTVIMSGTTDYDVFNVVQWNSAKYVIEGLYLNIIDAPYIDIEKPWWSNYYINEINIGEKGRYFLCGDISIDMIRCISCMYFNKNMFNNYYGNSDDLYNQVLDGEWTLDKLSEYALGAYKDLNGDSIIDKDDQFGLYTNSYNNIDILYFATGARVTSHDSDGMPLLTVNNEYTINVMDKLYKLSYNNSGVYLNKDGGEGTLWNTKQFNNGYGLFLMGFLYSSENLRDMSDDYGIIPAPKYDEVQDNYNAVVHDIATLICYPTTCTKVEEVSAVLEQLAYESWKNVTPAYYETAMKTKYTRDQLSSQIIDLLHDRNMTDMAYSYGDNFNGLGLFAREMIANNKSDFASYYAGKEKTALTNMQKLIDKYLELE